MTEQSIRIRILLVEDDKTDCEAVAHFIQKESLPYDLQIAASETEARGALQEGHFDVVLMGYNPGTTAGLDLLLHVDNTPVIFLTRKEGEEMAFQAIMNGADDYLFKDSGHNYLAVLPSVIKNVLQRKQEEKAQKKAKEDMLTATRVKSEFLANMNHELQIPMKRVIGMTDRILNTDLTPKQRKYTEMIRSSANSLLMIINDILDWSNIEAGKLKVKTMDFDLKAILEVTAEVLAFSAREKGLDLDYGIEPGVPSRLRGDPIRLRQAIISLITNAIKFTTRGKITIRVNLDRDEDERVVLRIEVTDTGSGIPKNRLDSLFNPAAQAGSSSRRRSGGTREGLSICQRLVEMMGGKIGAASEEGKGSTFWFTAVFEKQPPVDEWENRPITRHSLSKNEHHTARILLVEDDLLNRGLMMEQFKIAGFNSIIVAEDGREAVDLVLQHNPDLVLMDIQMPEMDGNEAIATLKQKGYAGPIVALSASAMKEDIEKSLKAGAADFITKPLDFDTILLKVNKYFKKRMVPSTQDAALTIDKSKDGEKNGYGYQSGFKIKASISKRIQDVFIKEAKEKLKTLNEVADEDSLEKRKKEITFISHGYKSNARLLGLLGLETAAIELNSALKKNEPGEKLIELVKKLSYTLKRIIEENE